MPKLRTVPDRPEVELDLPYVAGYFDAKGGISIRPMPGFQLSVEFHTRHAPVLAHLYHTYGGTCTHRWDAETNTFGYTFWQVRSRGAIRFLRDIRPHTRLRGPEIDAALKYHDEGFPVRYNHQNPMPDAMVKLRNTLRDRFYEIKHQVRLPGGALT